MCGANLMAVGCEDKLYAKVKPVGKNVAVRLSIRIGSPADPANPADRNRTQEVASCPLSFCVLYS